MTATRIMALPAQTPAAPVLQADFIGPFAPLDAQFGVLEKAYMPEGIGEVVFGPETTTYAIIDGAAVPGIADLADADALDATCLFTGDMEEELGDVAPWVVALKPDTTLTRHIFTEGRAPWDSRCCARCARMACAPNCSRGCWASIGSCIPTAALMASACGPCNGLRNARRYPDGPNPVP